MRRGRRDAVHTERFVRYNSLLCSAAYVCHRIRFGYRLRGPLRITISLRNRRPAREIRVRSPCVVISMVFCLKHYVKLSVVVTDRTELSVAERASDGQVTWGGCSHLRAKQTNVRWVITGLLDDYPPILLYKPFCSGGRRRRTKRRRSHEIPVSAAAGF